MAEKSSSEARVGDQQTHVSEPLFGPFDRNITPCTFWPTTNRQPTGTVHNTVPAIVVDATGDINAVLSQQHDAVNAYLNTGHLPAHDLTCARPADQ